MSRFLAVLLLGPMLAKRVARIPQAIALPEGQSP